MQKCSYCGKEYIENNHIFEGLPDFVKENIRFIPSCDCLEKLREKEMEEMEKKRIKECIMNKVKKYKDISVTGKKFYESKFENADMKELHMQFAKQYADNFLKKKLTKGLIFFGNVGIGKTFATACIANQLMDNGRTVLVMNLGLYINKLKAGGWEEAEQDILKQVEQCDLVIIDDFGAEKGLDNDKSTWRAEKIYNLIDTRYRAEKPLIISTNLKFDKDIKKCEIESNFKYQGVGRIRDRIADMCYPVRVVGENKRGMSEKEFLECIA